MGATLESFCCSNENREETQDNNHNPNGSTITTINEASKNNIMEVNKLPSNKLLPEGDINKFLEIKPTDDHPFQDYVLFEYLGKEEFSEVYMVKNKNNNDIFALKKLKRNKLAKEEEIKYELEKLKQLNHAYINKIYKYYITDEYIFLLEEFCSEGNLFDKIQKGKMFPEFIVKIIMFEIFKSLIYLNSKSLTHGNLKLENILVELNDIKIEEKVNKKQLNANEDKFIKAINSDMQLIYKNIQKHDSYFNFDFKLGETIRVMNKKINESQKKSESAQMSSGLRFGLANKGDDKLRAIPNLKYRGENNIYNSGKFEFLKYGIKLNDYISEKISAKNLLSLQNIPFSSPETISKNKSENCDIWACGIIMYYLLIGEYPFTEAILMNLNLR